MTVREIQGFLAEMYGVQVSPDLISTVTDGIVAEVTAWQSRPLERMYPVVFFHGFCGQGMMCSSSSAKAGHRRKLAASGSPDRNQDCRKGAIHLQVLRIQPSTQCNTLKLCNLAGTSDQVCSNDDGRTELRRAILCIMRSHKRVQTSQLEPVVWR
jgi:Transposase, Mutator family